MRSETERGLVSISTGMGGSRKLHFSVYDFDRFSRHDMIGEVIFDNLFEASDLSREATVWKDIHCATTVSYNNTNIFLLFDLQ